MSADLSSLKIDKSKREDYSNNSNKKYIKSIVIAVIVLVILIVGYKLSSSIFASSIEVDLTSATLQSPSQSNAVLTASGYVVAQRKADVASKATGRLVFLGVVEGDKVKKGQIIARIEDNDIKAQLDEAKANLKLNESNLELVKNNYERQKALLKTGSTTHLGYDQAEAEYKRTLASIDLAKAKVREVEVALENTRIRAPFDGTVLTKNADVGEVVAPLGAGINSKAAVVTLADMNSLQVEADVSESNIEKIKIKQGCQITLDAYPSTYYDGFVAKIIPTADRSKGTVMVKVGFKNYDSKVLPEMSAKILFLNDEKSESADNQKAVLVLPETAITRRNGKQVVFEVKDSKAVEVAVSTGKIFSSYVEITSGLKDGDQVIDNVNEKIQNGIEVNIK